MKKNILITGTSSGMGYSATKLLCKMGYRVFATVRTKKDAEMLVNECAPTVIPIILDIRNPENIKEAYSIIEQETKNEGIQGLINNAGICIGQPIEFMSIDLFKEEIDVNLIGLIRITQTFIPLLRKGKGRIININSTNGFLSMPFMGGYCATKFAADAISDALRHELRPWHIPVSVIYPDKIKSAIWEKSKKLTFDYFNSLSPEYRNLYEFELIKVKNAFIQMEETALSTKIIDTKIIHALESKKPKFSYLPGGSTKLQYILKKYFPKKIVFNLINWEMTKY